MSAVEGPTPKRRTRLRDARPDDYDAYAALFPELGVPDRVPSRARYESELMPASFVIEEDEVLGWGLIDTLDGVGFVRNVIVHPSARRRGLGRALMNEAARRFRVADCTRWRLNVKPENVAAVALYRALGMAEIHASVALRMRWTICARLPPATAQVSTPLPAELAAIEKATAIPAGMLSTLATLPERLLRVAREGSEVVGAACFDPGFPGCSPFRARSASVVRALFEALSPHATSDELQIVVEDQPEVVAALERAGARAVLAFVCFEGPLPE